MVACILGDPGAVSQYGRKSPWVPRARSIQPKFRPVRPEFLDHLKRWTRFFETFPVGPNRSIEFWAGIFGNFGWTDRAPTLTKLFPKIPANSLSWVLFVSSYTTAIVSPHLPGSFTKLVRAREIYIFYFPNQKRRNYRWVEKTFDGSQWKSLHLSLNKLRNISRQVNFNYFK